MRNTVDNSEQFDSIDTALVALLAGMAFLENLSKAADSFEIDRRIIFINSRSEKYILVIIGRCSIHDANKQLEVTCKLGKDKFKKHFLGLSNDVTYFAEQLKNANVSENRYRVIFKPESIVPDIDVQTSGDK